MLRQQTEMGGDQIFLGAMTREEALLKLSHAMVLPAADSGRNDHESVSVENDSKPAKTCLLYTSPSPRDLSTSRMPSSA